MRVNPDRSIDGAILLDRSFMADSEEDGCKDGRWTNLVPAPSMPDPEAQRKFERNTIGPVFKQVAAARGLTSRAAIDALLADAVGAILPESADDIADDIVAALAAKATP
ncbi:MAG: hypothetical protein ABIH03_10100 [Pseudomonadota bacterium]